MTVATTITAMARPVETVNATRIAMTPATRSRIVVRDRISGPMTGRISKTAKNAAAAANPVVLATCSSVAVVS